MSDQNWETQDHEALSQNSLTFEDSFFPALRNTDLTMRKGKLDIVKGPFNFVAKYSGQVMRVLITDVEAKPFRELSDSIFERDGKGGPDATLRDMQLFYPDITADTAVTAISYKPL